MQASSVVEIRVACACVVGNRVVGTCVVETKVVGTCVVENKAVLRGSTRWQVLGGRERGSGYFVEENRVVGT